jgi:hypothetical protein
MIFGATGYNKSGSVEVFTPSWSVTRSIGLIYSSGKAGMFMATTSGVGNVVATYNTATAFATVYVTESETSFP